MRYSLKHVYVFFLLILVILLVYLAQGISKQGTAMTREVEFNRVDGNNDILGKITQVSARINNKDTVNHKYTVSVFVDSEFFASKTVEVFSDLPYTYSTMIPVKKRYNAENVLVDDPTRSINFTVYRDDSGTPIDQIEFKYE